MTFSIPRAERSISEMLSTIPRPFKEEAYKGFRILAEISPHDYAAVLGAVLVALESKNAPMESLEQKLKLPKSDLSALFAASMLTISLLTEGGSSEEFLAATGQMELMRPETQAKVKPFLENIVADRIQMKRALRRAALPSQVLPYLTDFELAVDLRLAYEDNAVVDAVPVAVFHLDTDANAHEIWFQASKGQLERMKADVENALKKMDAAQKSWDSREK